MMKSKRWLPLLLVVTASATGCGRIDTTTQPNPVGPSPSSAPAIGSGAYEIEFPGLESNTFAASARSMTRISLDLHRPSKNAAPQVADDGTQTGARYPDSGDAQVRLMRTRGIQEVCAFARREELEQALSANFVAHDVGNLATVRIEFEHNRPTVDPAESTGLCYGTHAKGGGWTWSFTIVPIVLDTPWVFGGATGTGHIELAPGARNVDMIAVAYSSELIGFFLKRIAYAATPAE